VKAAKATKAKATRRHAGSPREQRIQEIRKRLVDQKEGLLSDADLARNALPDQTIFPDLGDQATAETDRNFMLRLRGREQRLIKKIEEAIERIDLGIFGICDMCGSEIGIKRLEVRPVTTLCIECKMEQEEEEKLMGD
jgi:DnaK suppressor protein